MKNWTLAPICRALIAINFVVFGVTAPLPSVADTNLPAMGEGAEITTSDERRMGDDIARAIYRDPQYLNHLLGGIYWAATGLGQAQP